MQLNIILLHDLYGSSTRRKRFYEILFSGFFFKQEKLLNSIWDYSFKLWVASRDESRSNNPIGAYGPAYLTKRPDLGLLQSLFN